MRRSNLLVVAGIGFFVVGVVVVALLARDNGSSNTSSPSGTVDVLVAKDDLAAGTNGDDVGTESLDHRVEDRPARLLQLARDGVGVDDHRTFLREHRRHRRLA